MEGKRGKERGAPSTSALQLRPETPVLAILAA
jgi:hypothetical protein